MHANSNTAWWLERTQADVRWLPYQARSQELFKVVRQLRAVDIVFVVLFGVVELELVILGVVVDDIAGLCDRGARLHLLLLFRLASRPGTLPLIGR